MILWCQHEETENACPKEALCPRNLEEASNGEGIDVWSICGTKHVLFSVDGLEVVVGLRKTRDL